MKIPDKASLLCGLLLSLACSAWATTFDAVKEFSLENGNPNGVWTYGYISLKTSTFVFFAQATTDPFYNGQETWFTTTGQTSALVERNASGQDTYLLAGNRVFIPADQLRLDGVGTPAVLRWTAPAAGVYRVTGLFQRNDEQADPPAAVPVTVSIVQDRITALFRQENFAEYRSQAPFDLPALTLSAGETLDFEVSATPHYNSTGLAVTISTDSPVSPAVNLINPSSPIRARNGVPGRIVVTLSQAQSYDVTIRYMLKGNAVNGVDYALLKGTVKIRAGQTSKTIKVKPLGDLGGAARKTVRLTLAPGEDYAVGAYSAVKLKIVR